MNIEFISAKRTSKHFVEATYTLDGTPFTVEWCNIHPETGEVCQYDLELCVECADEALADRIKDAISAGETDDNADIDIYLFIRDKFDHSDAESLGSHTLTATDWTIEKHGQTVIVKDEFDNTYEVFLQLPRTPDSQQTIDGDAVVFDDDFQEAVYEKAKDHLYGLFDIDDEIYFLVIGQYSNYYNVRYFEEADFTDLD